MYNLSLTILGLLLASYAIFTFLLAYFWIKIKLSTTIIPPLDTTFSIIIPVRNEANTLANLIEDLNKQTYNPSLFEVIIVDDSSTDTTATIAESYIGNTLFNLIVIRLPTDPRVSSPKKRAIETAIKRAEGNVILTTDGDCRVGIGWLAAFADMFHSTNAKIISGPVTFVTEQTMTDHLQTVEFSSLIGSGASAIEAGYPSLCNGANLAYDRQTFFEVGGFEGNAHIASGDDEFLMHKIANKYSQSVYFLKDTRAIVKTTPHSQWRGFYRQRVRWASKWKHYTNPVSIGLAVYIYACNAALVLAFLLGILGLLGWDQIAILFIIKYLPEWLFIGIVLNFLQKSRSIPYIPIVQILYPFYVTLFGLAGQKPTYIWKDRNLE